MNPLPLPASADHAKTPDPIEAPVALADAQLDRVAAGAVSVNLTDLPHVAAAAVDVATILQGPCCITAGMINPNLFRDRIALT